MPCLTYKVIIRPEHNFRLLQAFLTDKHLFYQDKADLTNLVHISITFSIPNF